MKEQIIVRVSSKKMNVNDFRKKYVTLKNKKKHEQELEAYAKQFLKNEYGLELSIPIKISGRLTSTDGYFQGRITPKGDRISGNINLSERFMASALNDGAEGLEAVLDTLRHELVHYALFKLGKNYSDGDEDFENELARLGIGTSGATRKDLVKSTKKNIWYSVLDIYEYEVYDITKRAIVKREAYKNHAQKQVVGGKRIAYEVVKSYF